MIKGQQTFTNGRSLEESAKSGDTTMRTTPINFNNAGLLEHKRAGQLPVAQGPNIKIEPPVKEGTRMPAK